MEREHCTPVPAKRKRLSKDGDSVLPTNFSNERNGIVEGGGGGEGGESQVIGEVQIEMRGFLDDFMSKLKMNGASEDVVSEKEILQVIREAQKRMMAEPVLLKVKPPVNLCGDIHGQFEDLVNIFKNGGSLPDSKYVFLGDYVDRGRKSVEVISLLYAYKARFPDRIYLLRGNHESKWVNMNYSFYEECTEKYSKKLYRAFSQSFNCMPVAAVVGGKIFCVHGGIGPSLRDINQISTIQRPVEVPKRGLLCDLLWADPSEYVENFAKNTDRNCSYIFGADAITEFLSNNKLELICRAHEVAMGGFKFFKKQKQLVTLFSAPKYDGYNNKGAIMIVSEDMTVRFKILT